MFYIPGLDKSENESPEKIEKCRKIDEEPDDKTEEDESGERTSESEVSRIAGSSFITLDIYCCQSLVCKISYLRVYLFLGRF